MEKNELFNNIINSLNQPLWENWYIKEKIGEGSFSVVYRITAQRLGRTDESALKIQPIVADGQIFNNDDRKRSYLEKKKANVVKESTIMYNLRDCPNVVGYEDEDLKELYINDKFEGYYFLIRMEYLTSVYSLMQKRMFDYSEKTILKITKEIGNGIAAAHRINIIHRDIKP